MLVGIVAAVLIIVIVGFGMYRGWFDHPLTLGVSAGLPLVLLCVLVFFKAWEYTVVPLPLVDAPHQKAATADQISAKGSTAISNIGHGVNRRLDDVSGNSIAFGIFVGACCALAGNKVKMRNRRRSLAFFLISSALGSAAYLYIVCVVNPGTFGYMGTGVVKSLQVAEGTVCLLILVLVHLCMARLLTALTWPSYRCEASKWALWMLGALGVATASWLTALPTLIAFADKGTYGMNVAPVFSDLIKFSLAVWWPLIPVVLSVIVAMFMCVMTRPSPPANTNTGSPASPSPS